MLRAAPREGKLHVHTVLNIFDFTFRISILILCRLEHRSLRVVSTDDTLHGELVENFFSQNCNISSVLSTFKYSSNSSKSDSSETSNLRRFSTFLPAISYRRVEEESGELSYTVWSLVMVREPVASALQGVKNGQTLARNSPRSR